MTVCENYLHTLNSIAPEAWVAHAAVASAASVSAGTDAALNVVVVVSFR